jgi:hypothetical protein
MNVLIVLLVHPSLVHMFSSATCSRTHLSYILPLMREINSHTDMTQEEKLYLYILG